LISAFPVAAAAAVARTRTGQDEGQGREENLLLWGIKRRKKR
jgi:hypothetical protein